MSDFVWAVIRQDSNGNQYRVGRFATREEAERIAETLDARGRKQLYLIKRIDRRAS